jgi:hypothetical protein
MDMRLRFVALPWLLFAWGCAEGTPEETVPGPGGGGGAGGMGECAGVEDGTPCGDDTDSACDSADTCLAGSCEANVVAAGATCGDATGSECDPDDTCDGAGNCVDNVKEEGAACGDPADNECTDPDTCDGMGSCLAHDQVVGYGCGDPTTNECTGPDICDGAGTCITNDEPLDTPCGSSTTDACTSPDTCDGMGVCEPHHQTTGTLCGNQTDSECTNPDTCDGLGSCLANHELFGVACGSAANSDCTDPDTCNGTGTCLTNNASNGSVCNDCPQGAGLCDGCQMGACTDECLPTPATLSTLFNSNNGRNAIMFDIVALHDLTVTTLDVNLAAGTHDVAVYYVLGGYSGHETTVGDWTLVGTATNVTSAGVDNPTPIPLTINLPMTTGQTYGIYVAYIGGVIRMTDGTMEGMPWATNVDMQILEGCSSPYPFGALTFCSRKFNGVVHYDVPCP